MLKVKKATGIYGCVWIGLFFFICLLYTEWVKISNVSITLLSIIVFVFTNYYFVISKRIVFLGLPHVFFIYASLSVLSCGWVYFLVGEDVVTNTISSYSARFFDSPFYSKAVNLSMLVFLIYVLGCQIGVLVRTKHPIRTQDVHLRTKIQTSLEKTYANIGIIFVGSTGIMFAIMMLTGNLSVSMTYSQYREVVDSSTLYAYVLLFYQIGICFIIACGNQKQLTIGIGIYLFPALIFFLTGNKGEVLYACLACIGIARVKGYKINLKWIIGGIALMFCVIPLITETRKYGVLSSDTWSSISLNISGFFVEIGTQVRCTVYMLEQFASGSRELIWGYSYYSPILNIIDRVIPFNIRISEPASFDFKTSFATMGFNQIAEGYANFGIMGALFFFFLVGYFLSIKEKGITTNERLAFYGSICAILINVSRNKFAFFWGHVLILVIIFYGTRFLLRRKGI